MKLSGTTLLISAAVGAVIIVIGGGYYSVIVSDPSSEPATGADAGNVQLVAEGKTLYAETCAACHGPNLEGQPNWRQKNPDGTLPAPPHDDTGHTWHHPDKVLFSITKKGGQAGAPAGFKSAMPPFAEILSDKQIWAVLSYIKSRWSKEAQSRQARINKRAG